MVCPIGPRDSEIRKRMDGIFREVIEPVTGEFDYRTEIAIHDKSPGIVTEGIVTKLIEADLVIADLHGHNGNVMYEVAIRHATGEPIIQMMPEGEELPFDIGGLNTVTYDSSLDQLHRWREDLRTALQAVAGGETGSNPVARAGLYRALEAREFDKDDVLADIYKQIGALRDELRKESMHPGTLRKTQFSHKARSLLHDLLSSRPSDLARVGWDFRGTDRDGSVIGDFELEVDGKLQRLMPVSFDLSVPFTADRAQRVWASVRDHVESADLVDEARLEQTATGDSLG